MRSVVDWFKARFGSTPLIGHIAEDLRKPVPKFVNGWYALGTAMLVIFVLQVISGLLLTLYYVPASGGATESVIHIMERVPLGWLVRSLHHWGASALVILALLHLGKALWTGAYRAPRELTWVAGVGLFSVVLGFGLTGYLLPWDQLSYWGTTVVTDSFGAVPVIGPILLQVTRGGAAVGDPTLLRFYVTHILLLPGALGGLVAVHLILVRHHGTAPRGRKLDPAPSEVTDAERNPQRPFWPVQILHELPLVYLIVGVFATIAVLAVPEVGTPADPFSTPSGIKPEWYFLPMYQLFKYIPTWLGIVVTTAAGLGLVALPWWDRSPVRWLPGRPVARLVVVLSFGGVFGMGVLGALSEQTYRIGGSELSFDILARPQVRPIDAGAAAVLRFRKMSPDSLRLRALTLLEDRCSQCHGARRTIMGLDLTAGALAENTVGVPGRQTGDPLIAPGDPDGSYLIAKVEGAGGIIGGKMPVVGAEFNGEELAMLRAWVIEAVRPTVSGQGAAPAGQPPTPGDRTGALIIIWAVLGFGAYAAWMKRNQLEASA
jgi:quinol-cytochrome oxidoreductase complex cytochrome b subunit